jgi:hypothetical protein
MRPRSLLPALLVAATVLVGAASCDGGSSGGAAPNGDAGPSNCFFGSADGGLELCFDASLPDVGSPLPIPTSTSTTGGPGSGLLFLKISALKETCTGTASTAGPNCTISPGTYDRNATAPASQNANALIAIGTAGWSGTFTVSTLVDQVETVGTQTCLSTPATCDSFKGVSTSSVFNISASSQDSGELAAVNFTTMTLDVPVACNNGPFDVADGSTVSFDTKPTVAALRAGPVKLTGKGTFPVANVSNLTGSVTCTFEVTLAPTNASGN